MSDSETKPDNLPQRLCNEIQLFELCDRASCNHKNGRFCADPAMLHRFETISDEDEAPGCYMPQDPDDEDTDGDCYDEEHAAEYCEGGEDDDWDDEEQ